MSKPLGWRSRVLAAASAALFTTCIAHAAEPVRIGVVLPLSGGTADAGNASLRGLQLAAEEINHVHGYMGRPVELVVKDDQSKADVAVKVSQELVADNVVAVVGFCNTGNAVKSLEVFQKNRIPLIVTCATGSAITATYPAPESYIFKISAADFLQASFLMTDILQRGWTRIAILADTTGYGDAALKDAQTVLQQKGVKPVYVGRFDVGVKDLSEPLKEARAAGANVLVSYTVGPESAAIAKSRDALGWKVPMMAHWTLSFPFFIDGAKEAAEGAMMVQTFIAEPSNERRAAFLAAYAKKFKTTKMQVPVAVAQNYDGFYVLSHALMTIRDGKYTGPAVKAALENASRSYYGVVGTYKNAFSPQDKEAVSENMLFMGMVRNGAITFAYPEDAKRNLVVQKTRKP